MMFQKNLSLQPETVIKVFWGFNSGNIYTLLLLVLPTNITSKCKIDS